MKAISNDELERMFDEGADVTPYIDAATVRRPNQEPAARRISMDVPEGMVRRLDKHAARAGVNRQALIKLWLMERLDEEADREFARKEASPA